MSISSESKHYTPYYDHVLGRKKETGSTAIVYELISDLSDRRGLRQQWEEIDGDIQDELIDKWIDIVETGKSADG